MDGPRITAKAATGWRGGRVSADFMVMGVLGLGLGAVAFAAGLAADWGRLLRMGLYLAGLGLLILIGHPVQVALARRRREAKMRVSDVAGQGPVSDQEET